MFGGPDDGPFIDDLVRGPHTMQTSFNVIINFGHTQETCWYDSHQVIMKRDKSHIGSEGISTADPFTGNLMRAPLRLESTREGTDKEEH